ncbi:MAG: UDP-2,3-diacylglucosamine diphosphatase [Bacteroidales bacterium]|nr:UDP-2,3-diacylglucosamine diphosphatase [Candidatus Physcousia equi]
MKNIYFLSDAHLGSLAVPHARQQERRLVRFLDEVKDKASAIYLLGDIFDFWFEYKHTVPKGHTRLLGKISELTDLGVEVHFFIGNHDIWCKDYFEKECGMTIHRKPLTLELGDQLFLLGHGDGLGDPSKTFRLLRAFFHNRFCQFCFGALHPRWGMAFGLNWAKRSRQKHERQGGDPPYMGEAKEYLVCYARSYLDTHPDVNYFVFGHRHIQLDLRLAPSSRIIILGDWICKFTYGVFDGEHFFLENYVEGES